MIKLLAALSLAILLHNALHAREIPSYNAAKLTERLSDSDTVYIVNFWATWCLPCVRELPEFDSLQQYFRNKPVKVLLVSFDFKENYPDKLTDWVTKRGIMPEVVWFSETNANEFIPKIERRWSGALPATLIIDNRKGTRHFIEDTITFEKVRTLIDL